MHLLCSCEGMYLCVEVRVYRVHTCPYEQEDYAHELLRSAFTARIKQLQLSVHVRISTRHAQEYSLFRLKVHTPVFALELRANTTPSE